MLFMRHYTRLASDQLARLRGLEGSRCVSGCKSRPRLQRSSLQDLIDQRSYGCDFRRRLFGQLQFQSVEQELKFLLGLGVTA